MIVPVPPQSWPPSPRRQPRLIVVVIILAFVAVMAGIGYAPAAALGVAAVVLVIAADPALAIPAR